MGSILKRKRRDELAFIDRALKTSKQTRRLKVRRILSSAWILILFGAIISLVAFFARPPHSPMVFNGMVPGYDYPAPFTFNYNSDIARHDRELEARAGVAPIYKPNLEEQEALLTLIGEISGEVATRFDELKVLEQRTARTTEIAHIVERVSSEVPSNPFDEVTRRIAMDMSILLDYCGEADHYEQLFKRASEQFVSLAKRGIYDDSTLKRINSDGRTSNTRLTGIRADNFLNIFSQNLTTDLWSNVFTDETPSNLSKVVKAVSNIYSISGLVQPNMMFDLDETMKAQDLAAESVPDVEKTVYAGELLLQKNVRINDESLERWRAFRTENMHRGKRFFGGSTEFFTNALCTFCILFAAIIFCSIIAPGFLTRRSRQLALAGTLIFLHIGGIRLLLELMESPRFDEALSGLDNTTLWHTSPAVIAAIIATVMLGAPLAVVLSLFSASVATLMLGEGAEMLLTSAMAILVAVYVSRNAMKRSRLLRAGFYSGLALAVTSSIVGLHDGNSGSALVYNLLGSIGFGLVSGIFAAGVLSILEGIFKITSNITLIELTDYNHPLLRRLQIVAPGTFHHSVMVGNFAARVAQALSANVALCRCAALYHDIGKTLKPEFFTENQTNQDDNPHNKITPSMSALIIKSHVREGSELASDYNLPLPVKDLIEQHHGRGLVSYFFRKAKELAINDPDVSEVGEANYRYDGPRPQTIEAAIMMMCDVVEAASRSLKKITPKAVENLIENLVSARISEGEFDECPITLDEIKIAKQALRDEVLRSNHSRISYQDDNNKTSGATVFHKEESDDTPHIRVTGEDNASEEKPADSPKDPS